MGIFDSLTGADAIKKAAKINARATAAAIAAQRENADKAEGYYRPYSDVGEEALNKLAIFGGLRGRDAQAEAYGDYVESPDVDFYRQQGENALARIAARRGSSPVAGRTLADALKFNKGLATQSFGDFIRRITDLKDTGFNATTNRASIRSGSGANIANMIKTGGEQQAQFAFDRGMIVPNLISNTIGAGVNLLGRYAEGGFKSPFGGSSSSYKSANAYPPAYGPPRYS